MATRTLPQCDMNAECGNDVTHIGEKGFIYCASCVHHRRGFERCRRMAQWELNKLAAGQPLQSYRPISKARSIQLEMERAR